MDNQVGAQPVRMPAVQENINYLQAECDDLAQSVFEIAAIVDRITANSTPLSETGVADNPSGLIGDISAITTRVHTATTLLREQNARLAELF